MNSNKGKIIIQGIDFTSTYNECMFNPIEKHFPKASSAATFPTIRTASKCMKIGMNLLTAMAKGTAAIDDNELETIADKFYAEEDELIKSFPKTYYTRYKKNLRSFIFDEIIAGILFQYEVASTFDKSLKLAVDSVLLSKQ